MNKTHGSYYLQLSSIWCTFSQQVNQRRVEVNDAGAKIEPFGTFLDFGRIRLVHVQELAACQVRVTSQIGGNEIGHGDAVAEGL